MRIGPRLGINMDMSAYVNNLSTCGLLCGHNFLLSMTRIMKLIFKNFHILCTLCNYERAMSNLGQATFEIGRKVSRILFMSKVVKGSATFPELVQKIEIIVLSRMSRNFNILCMVSPFRIPWILLIYPKTGFVFVICVYRKKQFYYKILKILLKKSKMIKNAKKDYIYIYI